MRQIAWLIAAFLASFYAFATDYQTIKDGPVHEAYIVQEYGILPLQAISTPPPQTIKELAPEQIDSQSVWLPGYWAWSNQYDKYLWVSGLWRKPPPGGKKWITGEWKRNALGWIWLRGFWSSITPENFSYITSSSPDLIDEEIPSPPHPASNYFWIPGYWLFDAPSKQFVWASGRWAPIAAHWIYFPPQYIWREEGYVFNPAYWDWPIDDRSLPYSSISIDPNRVTTIIYEPKESLDNLYIIEHLFPNWPNYYCLFRYHYFFHRDLWKGWGAAPDWWDWPKWWCFPWQDLWALWWWWSHPGYPNPSWLEAIYAEVIAPPPPFVVDMMKTIHPPLYITPNGVISMQKLLESLANITGKNFPVIPNNSKQVFKIQEMISPKRLFREPLKPTGTRPVNVPPLKPFFGPPKEKIKIAPQKPKIRETITAPPSPPLQKEAPQLMYPHMTPPLYESSLQGYRLNRYPQQSMHSEHHNHFMGRHQPQRNPPDAIIPNLYDGEFRNQP